MNSSKIVFVAGLFVLVTFNTVLAYDGSTTDGVHGDLVEADHHFKEPNTQQWSNQPVSSPGCPQQCSCELDDSYHVISVDCSSRGLTIIPDLPITTVVLTLENNSIPSVSGDSFKFLQSLQYLSLAYNNISDLPASVFKSQSNSLLNLNISNNDIYSLNAKLFEYLSQLKTLDVSCNIIKYLPDEIFSDLTQLLVLDLSFNIIDSLNQDIFKGLHSLRSLSLLNNGLDKDYSFPSGVFQDLVALETLNVKGNHGCFMQRVFLPRLKQRNITFILGETDFPGGDLMAHVTGAVVGSRKTVILLSADIFDDHHREFEMNLAIMREIDTRSLKIVPVYVEEVDVALYPREIEIFLRNQWQRCLSYSDSNDFWSEFVEAVKEDN